MVTIATARRVEREELIELLRVRNRLILVTFRRDGRPQMSPVSGGIDAEGRVVISTYPDRAKATNLRRNPSTSVLFMTEDWSEPYVQIDGQAEVLDMPDAEDALVEYFRCISGEHPDWDEYRQAMRKQNKALLRISIQQWGPVATGGFPPNRAPQ